MRICGRFLPDGPPPPIIDARAENGRPESPGTKAETTHEENRICPENGDERGKAEHKPKQVKRESVQHASQAVDFGPVFPKEIGICCR